MKLNEAIKLYISLRDERDALKKKQVEELAKFNKKMDLIEAKVMEVLDNAGTNSLNTDDGTAYCVTHEKATVADTDHFLKFCRENDEWSLMDIRASKVAIKQYLSTNGNALPPGINWTVERGVNFRR